MYYEEQIKVMPYPDQILIAQCQNKAANDIHDVVCQTRNWIFAFNKGDADKQVVYRTIFYRYLVSDLPIRKIVEELIKEMGASSV